MSSNMDKEINEILSTKNFPSKVNTLLKNTLLLIDMTYYKTMEEKENYLSEYIHVIRNLKGCAIIGLEELNEPFEVAQIFRKGIRKQEHGNLEYQNGIYISKENGSYQTSFSGFAWNREKMIFLLENDENQLNLMLTCYHELSHLQEGNYPFWLSNFPLKRWFQQMCCEGRVALKDEKLKINRPYYLEQIEDDTAIVRVKATNCYPLYSLLYQFLLLVFQEEILESFAHNHLFTLNMKEVLEQKFPQVPVDKIFGFLLYVLSCYHHISKHTILSYLVKKGYPDDFLYETIKSASLVEAFTFLEQLIIELTPEILNVNYQLERKRCHQVLSLNKNIKILKKI